MFFLKLGLLTCAIYVGLTMALEAGIFAVIRTRGGLMYFFPKGTHMFWTLGLPFGVIFGTLWVISFSVAWWIVYKDLKPILQEMMR
jgi:hypothetical protein